MKPSFLPIIYAWLIMLSAFTAKAQTVNAQDSLALVDLYNLTSGINNNAPWSNRENWASSMPLQTWYGVTVTGDRVTALDLHSNNLIGGLPVSFDHLTKLDSLDLSGNTKLFVGLGARINDLTALTYLNLAFTRLGLYVFQDSLKNFTALKYLNLTNTSTNALPETIGNLEALEYLDVSKCSITTPIPASIGKLGNLKYFNVSANYITGNIPDSVTLLTSLNYFSVSQNSLSGNIPFAIGDMSDLSYINLSKNRLSGKVPASIGNLTFLDTLLLNNNNLVDTIPESFYNLPPVLYIDLSVNNFTFTSLQPLASNFLFVKYANQGPIPLIINGNVFSAVAGGTLSNNTYKWYKNNALFAEIHGDSTLTIASPDDDDYTAAVTNSAVPKLTLYTLDTLRKSDSLAMVDVYNKLNGYNQGYVNYATPLATWPGVTVVKNRVSILSVSLPTGQISPSIGKLTALKKLVLQGAANLPAGSAKFNGPIPQEIGNLTRLTYLDLSNNTFVFSNPASTGIPSSIGRLTNLTELHLNNDNLTGDVPDSLKYLTNLQLLNVSQNSLTGRIAFLGSLTNLQQAVLNQNKFSDSIPLAVGNLTKLTYLNMESNNLYGSIPASIGNDTLLGYLRLSYNKLTGPIPASLGNLRPLQTIVLNNNSLDDSIPSALGGLVNLQNLILDYNNLSGNIPSSFGNLTGLTHLSLLHNTLSGLIPSFAGATALSSADFSFNQFSGNNMATVFNSSVASFKPNIQYNNFTFDGMAQFITKYPNDLQYFPQNQIPIYFDGSSLYVKVGEAQVNDTFRLFKDNKLVAAHTADSSFNISANGIYSITASSKAVKHLVLQSMNYEVTTLPVTLLNFTAFRFKADAQLSWQTVQEVNAGKYFVERSINGYDFIAIGSINAKGNSSVTQKYDFTDVGAAALSNNLYYRLRIVDKNGSYSYSKIISLQGGIPVNTFIAYPNPVKTSFIIQFTAAAPQKYNIALMSLDGKVLKNISIAATAATNKVAINVQDLPKATYLIKIRGERDNKVLKIIKE